MNWLNFFDTKTEKRDSFGRGTNADISPKEEELFNKSITAFENKNIIDAYEYFLNSLINFHGEDSNNNITMKREESILYFELLQGSAKVTGKITQELFVAEVIIVRKKDANVALKRYILERNYQLTYSHYFSDEEYIKLKVFLNNITMSPQKVFFPIREIALNADFDKEHIKSEFKNIELQDIAHINVVDEKELQIKYRYLKLWIEELNTKVLTLPSNDNTGMQAFLYLHLLFQIDYLLTSKYDIYQKSNQKIQEYFGEENSSIEAKNEEIKRFVEKLNNMSFNEFSANTYNAKYTFNPIEKTSYEDVVNFISESLVKVRWYKNNRYLQIIPTIYKYIAVYALYNYGLNQVLRKLLHLLIEIQNTNFFKELEHKTYYDTEAETFSKKHIISKIDEIIKPHQSKYQSLSAFGNELNFNSMNEFSYSFYTQLKNLDFEEV